MSISAIIVAALAVAAAAGLVAIVRTRWLQSRTLEKCVLLSVRRRGAAATRGA